ncbi:MAG TPA: hypothetical protein VFT66_18215 [Roseiflexaceae bacterium]|nr:hypothetical protein [Roseiflexaceae bacterium]
MRRISLFLLCALLFVLTGCADQVAVPNTASQSSTATSNTDTQGAASTQDIPNPTPSSDKVGTVSGRVVSVTEKHGRKPITGFSVYLGNILKSEKGVEGLVELDKGSAPSAKLDAQGNFAFTDVPPGRYGLMLDTPQGAILLNTPATGKSMIVEVQGGKSVNLGELQYPLDIG